MGAICHKVDMDVLKSHAKKSPQSKRSITGILHSCPLVISKIEFLGPQAEQFCIQLAIYHSLRHTPPRSSPAGLARTSEASHRVRSICRPSMSHAVANQWLCKGLLWDPTAQEVSILF